MLLANSPARLAAFKAWVSWTCRTPANPILQAAYATHLAPLGLTCDHLRYDPSWVSRGHYPLLDVVRPGFRPDGITDPDMASAWAPMAAIGTQALLSVEECWRLAFAVQVRAPDTPDVQAARKAVADGLVAVVNHHCEVGIEGFRTSVNGVFRMMSEPETEDAILEQLVSDPTAFYADFNARLMTVLNGD